MQVTKAVDYGIRALLVLASSPATRRHYLNDLAEKADVPRNYLVKILKSLSHAGIVSSFRGMRGGFTLAKDPKNISLRAVIEAIDGPVGVMPCLSGANQCSRPSPCAAQEIFRSIRERLLTELESHTMADLMRREAELRTIRQQRPAIRYESAGAAAPPPPGA